MIYRDFAEEDKYLSAGFATPGEIVRDSVLYDHKSGQCAAGGAPLLKDENNPSTVFVDASDSHSIIFGSTGSMKTRRIVLPTVCSLITAGESVVVADPKAEIFRRTSGMAKKHGYHIVKLDFRNPQQSDCWNPIGLPYLFYKEGGRDAAFSMLHDFVHSISEKQLNSRADPFWVESADSLCLGALLILLEAATVEECNIMSLVSLCVDRTQTLIDLSTKLPSNCLAAVNLRGVFSASEKTLSSILVTLFSLFSHFLTQPSLAAMLSKSSFSIDQISRRKTILYLIFQDEKTGNHFLVNMFVKQCYERLIANSQLSEQAALPRRVNFVLDEFGNLPPLSDCGQMLSAARSRNIRFFLICQTLRQLSSLYGENTSETILSNCGNLYYFSGRDLELINQLSAMCGTCRGDNGSSYPLLPPNRLMSLSKERGEVLLLKSREKPFVTELPDISEYSICSYPEAKVKTTAHTDIPVFDIFKFRRDMMAEKVPVPFSKNN